ncbi:MAG: hypothetical protein GXP62_11685, partial [Oligoflexia bacterium]|nr:hypothetical protein [Oligoflexia bacterium]
LGMRLSVYQDLFGADGGDDPSAVAAADKLAAAVARSQSSHYTTQELAWAVSALGKRAQAASVDVAGASLVVDGRARAAKDGGWQLQDGAGAVALKMADLSGKAWAVVSTAGVRLDDPVPVGDHGLKVRRQFIDAAGRSLDPTGLPLGTPIYVRVDVTNTGKRTQQNLALVDRLPAGWELENPRLSGAERPAWTQDWDLWSAQHMNLRDDRVEIFGQLGPETTRTVVYALRAVTAGSFVLPPVQIQAMYDPDLWSRQAGGAVEVVGPWDDGLL